MALTAHSKQSTIQYIKYNTIQYNTAQYSAIQYDTKYKNNKGKFRPRTGHEGPEMEYKCSSTLSLISEQDGGGWSAPSPGHTTPGKETRYPLYRRLGGPQSGSGQVRKFSPQPGFEPRTFQPLASPYADYAIAVQIIIIIIIIIIITLMHYIYRYIPDTSHVSRVYNITSILWLKFMVMKCLSSC
jgi:hypothetical protein